MAASSNGKSTEKVIVVPQLQTQELMLKIVGLSALIPHKWADKAKNQMKEKQSKAAKQGREARDPDSDFYESMYLIMDGTEFEATMLDGSLKTHEGQPALKSIAFKGAAVNAAQQVGLTKTFARTAFHVNLPPVGSLVRPQDMLVPIYGPVVMGEDMARNATGVADIRYRAYIFPWTTELTITFNSAVISAEQIANLFRTAGFGVGVGDWRPEKNGQNGMFDLATDSELSVEEPDEDVTALDPDGGSGMTPHTPEEIAQFNADHPVEEDAVTVA